MPRLNVKRDNVRLLPNFKLSMDPPMEHVLMPQAQLRPFEEAPESPLPTAIEHPKSG